MKYEHLKYSNLGANHELLLGRKIGTTTIIASNHCVLHLDAAYHFLALDQLL